MTKSRRWKLRRSPAAKSNKTSSNEIILVEDNIEDDSRYEEVWMGRTWVKKKFEIVDFDPKTDGDMPDCSSVEPMIKGYDPNTDPDNSLTNSMSGE